MDLRRCTKCGKEKQTTDFYKNGDKLRYFCKLCWKICRQDYNKRNPLWQQDYKKRNPWRKHLDSAIWRCRYRSSYKGRKVLISSDECKILWFRDEAFRLKHPSIDRIDNHGDYTFSNCRFIEHLENAKKGVS